MYEFLLEKSWIQNQGAACTSACVLAGLGALGALDLPDLATGSALLAGQSFGAPALLDYVQALVAHTRRSPGLNAGLSPRAAIGLLRAARAWALIAGRDAVIPEHVQAVFGAVVEHRVRQRDSGPAAVTQLLEAVPIP